MRDYIDLRVHDLVALDEIELYAEVLGAVAASDRPLTDDEIDEVLGVLPSAGRLPVRADQLLADQLLADQLRGTDPAMPAAATLPAAG